MQIGLRWLVKVRECESEFLVRESSIFSRSGFFFFFFFLCFSYLLLIYPCPPCAPDSDLKWITNVFVFIELARSEFCSRLMMKYFEFWRFFHFFHSRLCEVMKGFKIFRISTTSNFLNLKRGRTVYYSKFWRNERPTTVIYEPRSFFKRGR